MRLNSTCKEPTMTWINSFFCLYYIISINWNWCSFWFFFTFTFSRTLYTSFKMSKFLSLRPLQIDSSLFSAHSRSLADIWRRKFLLPSSFLFLKAQLALHLRCLECDSMSELPFPSSLPVKPHRIKWKNGFFLFKQYVLSLSLEMKYALNNVAVRLLNLTWAKFYGKLKSGYNVLADYFCARQQGKNTFTGFFKATFFGLTMVLILQCNNDGDC